MLVTLCAISISVHAQDFGDEGDPCADGGCLPPVTVTPDPCADGSCLPPVTVTPTPPAPDPAPTTPAPSECQLDPCTCNPQSCGVPPSNPCQFDPCSCNPSSCSPPPAAADVNSITLAPIKTPISSTVLNLTAFCPTGSLFKNGNITIIFDINPTTKTLNMLPNGTAATHWDVSSYVGGVWGGPYTQVSVVNAFTAQGVVYFTLTGQINVVGATPISEIIDVQYTVSTNSCHIAVRD